LVKQLLEHKADVKTKRTTDHVTALHIALHEQNWDIADILLESGADINAENDEGVTPLHIAVAGTRQFLNKNYNNFRFFNRCFSILEQNLTMAKKLLDMKANPNSMTNDGLTPLKIAGQNEQREMEELLASYGAKELDLFTILEDESLRKTVQESDKRRESEEH
jgi:ankyrin repeat protein